MSTPARPASTRSRRSCTRWGSTDVSLFTLHSVSKGFLGECGHRGGYLEIRNVPDDVLAEFIKQQSISLCANVTGSWRRI